MQPPPDGTQFDTNRTDPPSCRPGRPECAAIRVADRELDVRDLPVGPEAAGKRRAIGDRRPPSPCRTSRQNDELRLAPRRTERHLGSVSDNEEWPAVR